MHVLIRNNCLKLVNMKLRASVLNLMLDNTHASRWSQIAEFLNASVADNGWRRA